MVSLDSLSLSQSLSRLWIDDQQSIDSFEFRVGESWLSSWYVPLVSIFIYLFTIWALRKFIEFRKTPFDLNWFVIVYNSLLSLGSAMLFIALGTELIRMMTASSFFEVYCDASGRWVRGRVSYYYYLNYLFKFVELFDTILLTLRQKPTPFLHVYHHAATLTLCWSQLRGQSCVQWVPIIINLFIHVVMYLYFALHALKIDVWWKKYLTMAQIIQFVIAVTACLIAFGLHLLSSWFEFAPRCYGRKSWALFGQFILWSYLILFIQLFHRTYNGTPQKKKKKNKIRSPPTN